MPAPKPSPGSQEGAVPAFHSMESDSTATNILASVKEQELQFERLTRELEVERQIVANQLERCRLSSESPGAASGGSSEMSLPWRSAGSVGNSHSSTQMNSYTDSGYQDAVSYYSGQPQGECQQRLQNSLPASGGSSTLQRGSRAEGQAAGYHRTPELQVSGMMDGAKPGRAMRRVVSMPARAQSLYGSNISPSRGSLRAIGSSYGLPFTSTSLSGVPQKSSPAALRRMGSSRSSGASRTTSPYCGGVGSVREDKQAGSGSPVRPGMTAVPQHYGSMMSRTFLHDVSNPYITHSYEVYEQIDPRPDSLTGVRTSYSSQHSQIGADLRSATSPDRHIGPIYEGRTLQGPLYHSLSQTASDLKHSPQSALYRSSFGMSNLQRSSSQRSNMMYQRNNYALNSIYTEAYQSTPYWSPDPSYSRQPMDDDATRSPSVESMQKDPREFAWRDPDLPEVIRMLQHQFPSVQANAAAYLQHLCYRDNHVKTEVCRLGGIKHLVDLLDHKVLEVQRHACGALRNLVYGRATDDNKIAVRNAGGVPALLRLLRTTVDTEVRELVTGVLWNLSSCDAVKMTIIRDALSSVTNTVIIPHSGWSSTEFHDEHKLKLHSSVVFRNTTGCLRNLSSAGEEARKYMRSCEGLVDSLLYVIKACVSTSDFDSKIVENCICILRNLSYRLELEMSPSWLTDQELDGLMGSESPSKEAAYSCWGRKRRKKKNLLEEQWDGVGPIPGFSKSPKGAEMLWHPSVVKPYLTLLAESSNPATLEGSAGSLQNLSAGNWKFAAYIRAAVRKEKGLPILVELLRMDNDRVVCSIATALRNMALDVRNKELIGKYAMRDLVNRLPGGNTTQLSDDTVAAICCTLHEVTRRNMENAKALADAGGIEKLVNITKGRAESRYSMKVVKAAAQVLNMLWQYRDLRTIYKKDGWNQNHFLTPVSTLERERFKSQPTLPSSTLQMSPVHHTAGSTLSSPTVLGIQEHSDHQKTQTMQFYDYQEENGINKNKSIGSAKASQSYTSLSREGSRREQKVYRTDETGHRNHDTYRTYLHSPHTYEDSYLEKMVHYSPADYSQTHGFRTTSNYVDFYSSTRRPLHRSEHYQGSPDSWV
ncbi:plakophilin-4-like isoform X1 [Sinocyclocheilus grahami]|uniref:Plakophilin-4-like n=2 Tax=Sinocyclocheilus grahami TaxID=75366 RepID=A0A672SZZ0_SINGR|nr:PREDICTED: plakophilin-4-like isoform X1 [Sinocyclocheilus grahami]XP_016110376.1 PREDICTED: plakophilin-4-like isoform X1 [Sinocyclocheilus grahami]